MDKWQLIMRFLCPNDILNLSATCRAAFKASLQPFVWQRFQKRVEVPNIRRAFVIVRYVLQNNRYDLLLKYLDEFAMLLFPYAKRRAGGFEFEKWVFDVKVIHGWGAYELYVNLKYKYDLPPKSFWVSKDDIPTIFGYCRRQVFEEFIPSERESLIRFVGFTPHITKSPKTFELYNLLRE